MADLITIDDNGTLTTTTGASDDVFYLNAPNGTPWQVKVDGTTEDFTWDFDLTGTPVGRVEASATKFWEFAMANEGSLSWTDIPDPLLTPPSGSKIVCDVAATSPSGEACAGASSGSALAGCGTGVASSPGLC